MSTMKPLPKDSPLLRAWEAWLSCEDAASARRWATVEEHVNGSLWAAFAAGWDARGAATPDTPAAPERAESETQPIPVPPEYGRHVFAYRRGYECGLAARRMSPPSGRLWGTEDAIQAFQAGWRAGRDARPAPSTDALWREYEEARDAVVNRAFRDGRAGVPDDDESDAMTEARARLDAAVRALAAAPPAPPGEEA